MATGAIPGAELVSDGGPTRYVVPLENVETYRDRPQTHGTGLPDAAADLGLSYAEAYRLLCDLEIEVDRDPAGAFQLDELAMARTRSELARVRDLHARAVRHTEAAKRLSCSRRSVSDKLARGDLAVDEETDSSGAQFVTLASIDAYLARRHTTPSAATDAVSLQTAVQHTGMTERALMDLARAGHLERVPGRSSIAFTRCSLVQWCTLHRPEVLGVLGCNPGSADAG